MKEFDNILQYHIDNNLKHVSKRNIGHLKADQLQQLQVCLDLHWELYELRVRPAFGQQALREVLSGIDEHQPQKKFQWKYLKLGATAMAGLLIVIVIGGFSWLGSNNSGGVLGSDNVKPNGTVENTQYATGII